MTATLEKNEINLDIWVTSAAEGTVPLLPLLHKVTARTPRRTCGKKGGTDEAQRCPGGWGSADLALSSPKGCSGQWQNELHKEKLTQQPQIPSQPLLFATHTGEAELGSGVQGPGALRTSELYNTLVALQRMSNIFTNMDQWCCLKCSTGIIQLLCPPLTMMCSPVSYTCFEASA